MGSIAGRTIAGQTFNDLFYPDTTKEAPVMGLPPMGYGIDNTTTLESALVDASRNAAYSSIKSHTTFNLSSFATGYSVNAALGFDSYQQALQSFPILEIEPIDVTYNSNSNGSGAYKPKVNSFGLSYKFAVDPQNLTISYNHTNTYQDSNLENNVKTAIQSTTVNDVRQFAATSGGVFGEAGKEFSSMLNSVLETGESSIKEILTNLAGVSDDKRAELSETQLKGVDLMNSMGKVTAETMVGGSRVDFPNIWTDSQTQNSQTFTIQLRTISTNPKNDQYWREIILPLYCLLTLSLPVGGASSTYSNPPYIRCNLDNGFYETLLGGISSINVEFPASELNFLKVPRHITVTLTIVDMYSVMPQETSANGEVISNTNPDLTTKEKLIKRFYNMADNKSVANANRYIDEYVWTGKTDDIDNDVLTDAVIMGSEYIVSQYSQATTVATTSASIQHEEFLTAVAANQTEVLDEEGQESSGGGLVEANAPRVLGTEETTSPISDTISNHLSIHFSNGASKGNIVIEGAGIEIGTLKRVKNVTSTTASANVAVRDLVSGKSPLELSKGYSMSLQLNGETPEISQSFLNSVTSKVCTSLKNLFT